LSVVVGSGLTSQERGKWSSKGGSDLAKDPNPGTGHSFFAAHIQPVIILQIASNQVPTDREMTEKGRQLGKPTDEEQPRVPVSVGCPL
jgi:hypothetical protein